MNIFERIREDHDKQRTLVDILAKTSGNSDGRQEIFEKLKKELQEHADAEEKHFYVPLIKDDLTQEKARHSIAEHHDMDELIEEMEKTDMSSPGWLSLAKKLKDEVEHHLDEEEHEIFQMAGKVLSEDQKTSLAKKFDQEREQMTHE